MSAMLDESFDLTPERLDELRGRVRAISAGWWHGAETVESIVLALDEALQNVLRYAYGDARHGRVDLRIRRDGDSLRFEIRDYAPRADLATIKPRPLDDIRPGGLGTHLIRTIMDEVVYGYPARGPGNLLTLRKRLGNGDAHD